MSRNKEKALAGLNRYYEQKTEDATGLSVDPSQRPKSVQKAKTLPEAELWRRSLLGEFLARLSDINNPSLSEAEIRLLNDTLNKMYREKRAWEHHIKALGGNDYSYEKSVGTRIGNTTYYGRARELPEAKQQPQTESKEALKRLPLDYYGVYDSDVWVETPIVVDRTAIMEQINTALGEAVLPAPVGQKVREQYTEEDVEAYLVEQRKKELLRQIMGS